MCYLSAQTDDFNSSHPATITSADGASLFAPRGEKLSNKPHIYIGLPSYTTWDVEEREKKFKQWRSTREYFSLEGEKK